jgi:cobalt-zinc-cadmium efflux system protein
MDHSHDHHGHHGHDHDHASLRKASGRALRIALVVLGVFFVVELVGGILTNSLALISDAAHLLSDVAAVGLALFAQWFASRPASAERSFGYRRVEILAAQLNGFTLLAVAVFIVVEAFGRIKAPPPVHGLPMIAVAAVGLVAQLITTVVLARAQGESLNVRGAYLHAMTDAVQSVGVVIAGVVMLFTGWYIVDPIVSVLIAALVAWSGGKILFEASHVLIEGTPKGIDLDAVARMMEQTPGVLRVTDLHAWSLTTGYNALTAHLMANPDANDLGHDALRRKIVERLHRDFSLQHVTLQIEKDCEACRVSGCCNWLQNGQDAPGAASGEEGS